MCAANTTNWNLEEKRIFTSVKAGSEERTSWENEQRVVDVRAPRWVTFRELTIASEEFLQMSAHLLIFTRSGASGDRQTTAPPVGKASCDDSWFRHLFLPHFPFILVIVAILPTLSICFPFLSIQFFFPPCLPSPFFHFLVVFFPVLRLLSFLFLIFISHCFGSAIWRLSFNHETHQFCKMDVQFYRQDIFSSGSSGSLAEEWLE